MLKLSLMLASVITLVAALVPITSGQEPEAPRKIRFELTASEDPESQAVRLPGLAIEVHAVGRSNRPGWTPILPLTFLTNEQGVARGELELPASLQAGVSNLKVTLRVRVRDSRFRYEPMHVRLLSSTDKPLHARVRPKRGGTVRGRVVNQNGQPAPARITLLYPDRNSAASQSDEAFPSPYDAVHTSADASGEFELHYTGLGSSTLRCQQSLVGASSPVDLELAGGLQPTELRLRLEGESTLTGRLTDRRGDGIADVRVSARLNGLPVNPNSTESPGAPGITEDRVIIDSNGEFHFAGLRPGEYIVQYGGSLWTWVQDGLSCTAATDASDAQLVFPASRVELTVLDLDGTPQRLHDSSTLNLPYFYGEYQLIDLGETTSSSELPWARFGECGFASRHTRSTRNRLLAQSEFRHSLVVTAGRDYRLRLFTLGGPPSTRSNANDAGPLHPSVFTQEFRVDESEPVTRVVFHQPDPAKLGTLKLVVAHEHRDTHYREYHFAVRRSHENDTLFDTSFDPPKNGRETVLQLEPGEYVVLVTDTTVRGVPGARRPSPGNGAVPIFKQESTVRIEPGAQRIVEIRPVAQGRLQLELRPVQAAELQQVGELPTIQLRSLDTKAAIETRWLQMGNEANPEVFELGETRVALEVLPPGKYEIEVSCEPFETHRESFAIRADELITLRVELAR